MVPFVQIVKLGIFCLILFTPMEAASGKARANTPDQIEIRDREIGEEFPETFWKAKGCTRATASQIALVNSGNKKSQKFAQLCARETNGSPRCAQIIRPNPSSLSAFQCTYGTSQPHQLIHPDEKTWAHAFAAIRIVDELERKGMKTCLIYNWWRPEPYNKNVGGAAGRHPFGTSVDVRLCSDQEAILAFDELCKMRKKGKIRAIGYYGSSSLHFGIGDKTGNTWGKNCP